MEKNSQAMGGLVLLIVGVSVAILVLIFTGTLSGAVYSQAEPQLNSMDTRATATQNNLTITGGSGNLTAGQCTGVSSFVPYAGSI